MNLKSRDEEKVKIAAGHVLTEAWSDKFNKWFLLDGQVNIVPVLDGIPLNAIEFQDAILNKRDFQLINANGEVSSGVKKRYTKFVGPYLYYMNTRFDQREILSSEVFEVNGKSNLMLVPVGAKNPTVFQRKYDMNYLEYTNSISDFYRKPVTSKEKQNVTSR